MEKTIGYIRDIFQKLKTIGFNFNKNFFKTENKDLLDISDSFIYYYPYLINSNYINRYKMLKKLEILKNVNV